jgi:hypothetical protein
MPMNLSSLLALVCSLLSDFYCAEKTLMSYLPEICFIIFIVVYGVNFLKGRAANERIARHL